MPNLWTKAWQKINEKLSGPRTNDVEIKKKFEEASSLDKALLKLRNIISNFSKCFEEIMRYNREISESIFVLYDNNLEYKEFAYVLNKVHVENNKLFKDITNEINDLSEKTKNWPSYFSKVKDLYEEKENSRKVYDHYEVKLEELIKENDNKLKKGQEITKEFQIKLTRNEEKYLKAKQDYIDKCIYSYDTIEGLLNDRFNLINKPLLSLFYIEMKIYENFSSRYLSYKDLESKLSLMRNKFEDKDLKMKYDPTLFLKNPFLESKIKNNKNSETLILNTEEKNIEKIDEFRNIKNNYSVTSKNNSVEEKENTNNLNSNYVNLKNQNIDEFFQSKKEHQREETNANEKIIFPNNVSAIKNFDVESHMSDLKYEQPFQFCDINRESIRDSNLEKNGKLNYPTLFSILDQNSQHHNDTSNLKKESDNAITQNPFKPQAKQISNNDFNFDLLFDFKVNNDNPSTKVAKTNTANDDPFFGFL